MKYVAKLVTVTLTTRVVVLETATDTECAHAAQGNFIDQIDNDIADNIESVKLDTECPYDPNND